MFFYHADMPIEMFTANVCNDVINNTRYATVAKIIEYMQNRAAFHMLAPDTIVKTVF